MKSLTKRALALTGLLALGLTAVHAQSDGALLDALVKKGVLSDQEAEDVRASEAKDYATTSAGKLTVGDHISNLKLYGDGRLRFEYLNEKAQNQPAAKAAGYGPNTSTTDRSRYRLRVGADYTYSDNFSAGFELESNGGSDSANQTMGAQYNKFGINIGLIYLQWKPTDWLTLVGGKQRNPLYTTDLMWDPDINPEGASEAFLFHPMDNLSIGLTAAQFIYQDNSENTATPVGGQLGGATQGTNYDVWSFVEQVPVQFNFNKDTFVKEVPGFYMTQGGGTTGNATGVNGIGSTSGASVAFTGPHSTDNLYIVTAPGEVDWKLWDKPMRAYWDFAWNVQGNERVQDVYLGRGQNLGVGNAAVLAQNQDLTDNVAWLAGLQVGVNKKKGDWSVKGDFRQIGLGSVDPDVNDSDFGDSFLNQQGVKFQSQYNFTDFLVGSVTFFDTWAYKNNLMNGQTPGQNPVNTPMGGVAGSNSATSGGVIGGVTSNLAGVHSTQRVQVDLVWKF